MDFRLKVFHSVATNLSFTKASKELFISQPAISKHIHELEVALAAATIRSAQASRPKVAFRQRS